MINKFVKWFFSLTTSDKKGTKKFDVAFNKEIDGLWYIDVPTWKGSHHNLLLVDGCDDLMEHILMNKVHETVPYNPALYTPYIGRLEFQIETSNDPDFDNHKDDIILEKIKDDGYGATYKVYNCEGFDQEAWICPVTLYVFGEYPNYMYGRLMHNEVS